MDDARNVCAHDSDTKALPQAFATSFIFWTECGHLTRPKRHLQEALLMIDPPTATIIALTFDRGECHERTTPHQSLQEAPLVDQKGAPRKKDAQPRDANALP